MLFRNLARCCISMIFSFQVWELLAVCRCANQEQGSFQDTANQYGLRTCLGLVLTFRQEVYVGQERIKKRIWPK